MDAAFTAPMATARGTEPTDNPDDPGYGLASDPHPLDGLEDERGRGAAATDPADAPTGKKTRSVGANRHLTSLVLALVAVPAGYGFIDYSFVRAQGSAKQGADITQTTMIMMAAAAGCFLVATLAGRISAMGPLVAALLWGAAPAAWVILDYPSFVDRLNDLPEFWNQTGFGLATAGFAVFPVVTGLLIGGVVTGRWRRPASVSRW